MIMKIKESTTLMIMDVMIGKYTVVFPFFQTISPGSLPIYVPTNPIIIRMIPATINSRFNLRTPPVQSNDRPVLLPSVHEEYVVKSQSEEDTAHKHLQSSWILHLL